MANSFVDLGNHIGFSIVKFSFDRVIYQVTYSIKRVEYDTNIDEKPILIKK